MNATLLLMGALVVAGCEQVESVRASFERLTPHEQYAAALGEAGLMETALARTWLDASLGALDEATSIALPFREARYLDPAQPAAVGYRFDLQRGQQLLIDVTTQPGDTARVFVDLFEAPRDSTGTPRHIRSAADSTRTLAYTIRRTRTYLLRVQPELLRGGRYTITAQTDASLAFPVAGKNSDAIRSVFGAPRDGGRRRHHGVDIFAARGTPVIAAANAAVTRVRNGGLGGKVVWLRDSFGRSLYYAHLDSQIVRQGMRVSVGDTVGLVGNTGNARTTPPHLHFGIYRNGPVDPFPFIHVPRARPATLRVDTSRFGQWTRVAINRALLRAAPRSRAEVLRTLPRHTAFYVAGGSGTWYRVRLPDRTIGYVAAVQIEPAQRPVQEVRLADGRPMRRFPAPTALSIDSLAAETPVAVLGRFESFLYVASPSGRTGWIAPE
ncbi:MAG: peptidoglycan DD-metalloendopeptidase family protein [Rhodothermales bacterium]